jgi:predicted alpha/beta-fold hydrolase
MSDIKQGRFHIPDWVSQYIGEEGPNCLLKAAVVCSNPWNLDIGSNALQRTWLGREIYSKTMGNNMKKLIMLHADQVTKNPKLDLDKIMKVRYLHEFDREVQGPTWGYPTEGAYYRDASSVESLLAVRIPLFAINASDDPVGKLGVHAIMSSDRSR